MSDFAGIPRAGYQPTGDYVLSAEDQRMDCRRLHERSEGLLDQLKALPYRAAEELKEAPSTVAQFVGRVIGDQKTGVSAVAEFEQGRAEAVALNDAMAQKGCETVNVEAELSNASAEISALKAAATPAVATPTDASVKP